MLSDFLLDTAKYIRFANNLVYDRVFCITKNYFWGDSFTSLE